MANCMSEEIGRGREEGGGGSAFLSPLVDLNLIKKKFTSIPFHLLGKNYCL